MPTEPLTFLLVGDRAEEAATQLQSSLAVSATDVKRSTPDQQPDHVKKIIDPISLAALILSIPSATLAVMDLADRIAKRRKAQAVIDAAKQVKTELNVHIMIIGQDGASRAVASLGPDELLETASASRRPPA